VDLGVHEAAGVVTPRVGNPGELVVRIHARVIWTLIFLFTLCSVDGAWAGPPTDQLREGVDRVGKILKDPELAADTRADERRVAIGTAVDKIFDFSETAKRSLGQYWAQRTPAEREEFVRLFTDLFKRTYVSKVDQFNSEMTYRGETVEGDHAVVRTTLLLAKGGEISLDYLMHHPGNRWQVYDLNIDGISFVANYRAQFNKIIRTSSYEALVTKLKSRQAEFLAPAAAAPGAKPVQ
jgi:phospholipid transport system substrate-binding protein